MSILRLEEKAFTLRSFSERDTIKDFKEYFADSSAFAFGMDEIRRLRSQIEVLIKNLSKIYQRVTVMKKLEKCGKKGGANVSKDSVEAYSKAENKDDEDKTKKTEEKKRIQNSSQVENLCQNEANNNKMDNQSSILGLKATQEPSGEDPLALEAENNIDVDKSSLKHADLISSQPSFPRDEIQKDQDESTSLSGEGVKQCALKEFALEMSDLVPKDQSSQSFEEEKSPFEGERSNAECSKSKTGNPKDIFSV